MIAGSGRFRNCFDATQQENIAGDTQEQESRGGDERTGVGVRCSNDVPGENRRGDGRELVAEIQNSAQRAHAFTRGDQGGDGPTHRRRGRQSTDGHADPEERGDRRVSVGGAENAQPENGSNN